jgi:hypothetical protein
MQAQVADGGQRRACAEETTKVALPTPEPKATLTLRRVPSASSRTAPSTRSPCGTNADPRSSSPRPEPFSEYVQEAEEPSGRKRRPVLTKRTVA